jgi:anti-sigma B factor antagonist
MTATSRIDIKTFEKFETALYGLVERGKYKLVLDLNGVDWLNTGGLKALNKVRKAVQAKGGDIVFAQPSDQVLVSLEILGFDVLFKFFPTREDAVGSF